MHPTNHTSLQNNSAGRRHICIVTETYPPEVNGVALTLRNWVERLRRDGYLVSIVRPRQQSFDSSPVSYDPMVTLVPGLPLPGYNGLQFGLPAAGRLSRYWKQHRPDVVYVATEGPLGWSAMRVARRLGIRIFSGFHTSFHSYLKHYHVGWLHFPLLRYLCWFHNRTVGTVVPSVELRDRLQAIGLKNVSVVGRGVDAQVFNPNQRCPALRHTWGASSKDLVALYVGRVAPEKNLDLAIKAYRAMQRVDSSVKFAVVGDGPVRGALQKKHPDIIFCGVQTDEQLAKRYASADIFLFPSETETFGNVTLEAMASGLAVVAYDYAAAHLHIVDRHTGMLAPYGNAQAFVDAAVQLVQRRKSLIKMRHLARAHITTVDWQRIVETFAALLMNPLQQSDAGAEEDHSDSFAADEFATELH